tara:strand:- start:3108 stop:3986 length:879 start_codon:yes stop_codon:yes gene_type:complete
MKELATVDMTPIQVAEVFVQSGMFPDSKSVATAASKLIVGRGLGLTDYDAMAGLHIIKGKVVLAANTMAAAIKASGKYDYRAKTTESECVITFFEVDGTGKKEEIGSTTFTIQDANNAGLRGDNWRKWPKAMLFARAISSGYREHCPDALGSAPVYVHEHGESEIPEAPASTVAPQRETPQMASEDATGDDTSATPKEALVALVNAWVGCETSQECYELCKQIMTYKNVPVDGTASDDEVKALNSWVEKQMQDGVSLAAVVLKDKKVAEELGAEVVDVQAHATSEDSDPWGG